MAKYIVEVKVVEYDQWLEIFSKVNTNESKVISQITKELEKKDPGTWQKWYDRGFDINYMFNDECTLLHMAALNGCLDIVKYLIEQRKVDVNQASEYSNTALHCAASNGHLDIVKYLVDEKGADFNQADNNGDTALHATAYNGYLNTVRYLIDEKKVDVNQANNNGRTALHGAARNGHLDTVRYLIDEKKLILIKQIITATLLYIWLLTMATYTNSHYKASR